MTRTRSNFKMGTVEMLILFLLEKKDLYGYEIAFLIKQLSKGNLVVPESTLYPTFYKLLDKKYISDKEIPIGKRRIRVYYHLEEAGRDRLTELLEDYKTTSIGINNILSQTTIDHAMEEK